MISLVSAVLVPGRLLLLLLTTTLLLAGVAVAPAAAETRSRIDQESWVEWQIADALSEARQAPRSVDPGAGEPAVQPLTGWSDLRAFARRWSDAMAQQRTMSHNPAFASGYCCWQAAGEVLAKVRVGDDVSADDLDGVADRAVRAWFDSPAHRQAMLDGRFDHVGVGVTIDHAAGVVWVAVDLRQVASGETPPGGPWYQPGTTSPGAPAPGWPCDSQVAPFGATTWPLPDSSLQRRDGRDRVGTALALADEMDAPHTVLLASAATPSDALAAAGLAGTTDAPVLLTGPRSLDDRVARRLRQWRPDEVVLLGGHRALSDTVARQADRAAPSATVDRVRGHDRFGTAAAIAERLAQRGGNDRRVVLALGSHPEAGRSWADAVTVSGLAASHRHPVLLTEPGSLPTATRRALQSLAPSQVVVPGGPAAVFETVLDQVRDAVPDARVRRVAGADRYATSRAVVRFDQALRSGPTRRVHLVSGRDWPDALTAGPAAAHDGAVVALVDGAAAGGGPDIDHVEALSNQLRRLHVTLVGGEAAISSARAGAVRAQLHCL